MEYISTLSVYNLLKQLTLIDKMKEIEITQK